MIKIAVLDDWSRVYVNSPLRAELERLGEVEVFTYRLTGPEQLVERLMPFHVIVPFRERTRFPAEVLNQLPNLRLIAQTGSGTPHIDIDCATERGVAIATTPGGSAVSVAEHILGMMLSLAHKLDEGDRALRRGEWPLIVGQDLAGKRLGILGLGKIGRELASRAKAFGMRVVAWSPTLTPERARASSAEACSFEALFQESDFLSVNARLTPETRGLIGRRELALLPEGAYLINTARGPIVDEGALLEALESGRLAGAGLDVFDVEPLPANHPLRRHPNVLLTPHTGHTTRDTYEHFLRGATENIEAFLRGAPTNVLNPKAL